MVNKKSRWRAVPKPTLEWIDPALHSLEVPIGQVAKGWRGRSTAIFEWAG